MSEQGPWNVPFDSFSPFGKRIVFNGSLEVEAIVAGNPPPGQDALQGYEVDLNVSAAGAESPREALLAIAESLRERAGSFPDETELADPTPHQEGDPD